MRAWLLRHRCRVFLHRIRFPGQAMFSSAAADDLIGKRIIVGITYEDHAHRPVRQEQYHTPTRLARDSWRAARGLSIPLDGRGGCQSGTQDLVDPRVAAATRGPAHIARSVGHRCENREGKGSGSVDVGAAGRRRLSTTGG
jgi:hypothetical protein